MNKSVFPKNPETQPGAKITHSFRAYAPINIMSILRNLPLTLIATSALGLCLSCGGGEKTAETTTAADTTNEVAAAATEAVESAPTANLAAGKAYFEKTCMPCHGMTGKGDGAAAAALNPKPRDLSDMAWQDSVDDAYVLKVIVEGGAAVGKSPLMAGFGPAIDNDPSVTAADVAAHVRSLGGK